jgi:eukaryotic-like serine/threonine-protein kinase
MTPERRDRIEQICQAALDRDATARAAFLADACAGDEALRREVESLLACEQAAEQFIETPALQSAAESLAAMASVRVGEHIGTYEILSLLGTGGMGEVYRARDAQLGRDVAIKVLPPIFLSDLERLARFEREARVLASLNHPNIGTIYGLERTAGSRALVLELVDGPTLAETLREAASRKGSGVELAQALAIARQIATALEAAHEKGIVHRDLKPANVKITPDGTVKVLDFGLAKLVAPSDSSSAHGTPSDAPVNPISSTRAGVVLGTAAYMSPEQARGQAVDKRTDIWAFGCVLYELLTGRAAFARGTVTDTIAAVVSADPDWSRLPTPIPGSIRRLLRRCLRKEEQFRLRDIGDARLEIDEARGGSHTDRPMLSGWTRGQERRAWAAAATLLLVTTLLLAGRMLITRSPDVAPESSRVTRLMITAPRGASFTVNAGDRVLALSPDGTRLVYVGGPAQQLFVRPLDGLEATPLTDGRASLRGPFMSPDGRWVGYFSDQGLRKIPISGGPAITLCSLDGTPRGASWGQDGSIVFATFGSKTGLWRVSDAGGDASVLTRPDPMRGERDHVWPELLPGGRGVLFTVVPIEGSPMGNSYIAVLDRRTGAQKIVVKRGRNARYLPSGHLVYSVGGDALHAVAFDLDRLEATGTPVPVLSQVVTTTAPYFDVSRQGTLVYMRGPVQTPARALVWVDRNGREEQIKAPVRAYEEPRISPDGKRVAVVAQDDETDIWMWDFTGHEALRRFTFGPSFDIAPLWTPDGSRVLFASNRMGMNSIFWQSADGSGAVERLTDSPHVVRPETFSPDGKLLVIETNPATPDIVMLTLDAPGRVQPLVQTPAVEGRAALSPDGRWLAYESWETGTDEVYVRPFPDVNGGKWQVSTGGGGLAAWARTGEELFYVDPTGALMSVRVGRGATWNASPPQKLLDARYFLQMGGSRNYDVSPDGKRFLMIKSADGPATLAPQSLVVVQNWFEELRRLVPARAGSDR